MLVRYVINKNCQIKSGEHKLHVYNCSRRPQNKNAKELGEFDNPKIALFEAFKYYTCVNACKYCLREIYLKNS